jgi:predicted permease
MKIPILEGRDFGPQDERQVETSASAGSPTAPATPPPPSLSIAINQAAQTTTPNAPPPPPRSVVINQTMARYFYGAGSPIGKRFRSGGSELEIIGVVKDTKYSEMRQPPPRTFYLYYLEQPRHRQGMTFQFRTGSDQLAYGAMIIRLAREIDPQLQVINVRTMEDVVNDALVQERFTAQLGSAFSLFALLLACVGLYGLMSYAVARRTNEIGIRMALGAQARDVVMLVMRETMLMVMAGVVIGLGAALAATRLVSNLLYGLTPGDPLTIALAASLMIAVAALAGYLPARRASRIDPMIALHYE